MGTAITPAHVERIETGYDWLSCTLLNEQLGAEHWYTQAQHIILEIGREGYDVKERSLLGFDGISAGNNFVGVNHERCYLQLSSHRANDYFSRIHRDDLHYSRVDVQATVWFSEEFAHIAREAYNVLSSADEHLNRQGNRKYRVIIGSDGGDTFYLGSPSSDQQARVYNKCRESEKVEYKNAWRYEITLRDKYANAYIGSRTSETDNTANGHLAYVYAWFDRRGLLFSYLNDGTITIIPRCKHTPSDVETKLKWMGDQVRPAIEWLTERGYRDKLIEALGL
jgi:DNA relaxase NicK